RNPLEIERDYGGVRLHPRDGEQGGIGQPLGVCPEKDGRRRDPRELPLKAIPQGGDAPGLLPPRLPGGRGGCTEARNRRNGLRAGTETPLLTAAADQRVGEMLGLGANDERTGSLWAAELVAGKAEKIGTQVLDRDGDAAGRLNRVDVQQPP